MKNNYSVLFKRNSGKIEKTMEGLMSSMLKMWGLQGNVPKSCDYVVFDEDGVILAYYEGKGKDMPNICKDMEGMHINKLCEGFLEAVKG